MFKNKKTMQNGYQSSSLKLNSELSKFDKWTIKEMNIRSEDLARLALSVWPMLQSSYQIPKDEILRTDVGGNLNFSNKNISSYEWYGKKILCNNWANMYVDIVKKLYEKNNNILTDIVDTEEKGFKNRFVLFACSFSFIHYKLRT